MKAICTLFILLSSLTLFSQTEVAGKYEFVSETKGNDRLEYHLTLHPDGTFSFHYYRLIKQGIPPETNQYGQGTWKIENNVVSFFSDRQKDVDQKHTLDFTNTRARYVIKSPRDQSEQVVKTRLAFLESDIPWMKRIDLLKI